MDMMQLLSNPDAIGEMLNEVIGGAVKAAVAEALLPLEHRVQAMEMQVKAVNDILVKAKTSGGIIGKILGG